jgi:uncharacterized membrane protein (UPF0127 family)
MAWFNKKNNYFKAFKLIFGLIILILITSLLFKNYNKDNEQVKNNYVKIKGREFLVEIAQTPDKHYQGLSFRESICGDCGMLFIFPEKTERTFVMRNMLFPLDIIFIEDETVVNIYKNLEPEGSFPKFYYKSFTPVNRVLELNAGLADELNLQTGDKIIFK